MNLACNCSNCDPVTGRCSCPAGVEGDSCDRCIKGTFGFDPVIGCQPCSCDSVGTIDNKTVCDSITGQCQCQENFGSRKCSECEKGFFNYPVCQKCDCHLAGVNGEKCDARTGECFCQVRYLSLGLSFIAYFFDLKFI